MNAFEFVQNVKKHCELKGIKPTVACRESGVGTSFINNIEKGSEPSVAKVQKLATYLGVTTSELLGEKIEPTIVVEGGLSEEQQELVSLYKTAPSDFRRATLEMLRSAVRQGAGVGGDPLIATVKGASVEPVKVLGAEQVAVEAVVPVAGKVKKLPYGRAAVRPKRRATSRGRGRGGPFKGNGIK